MNQLWVVWLMIGDEENAIAFMSANAELCAEIAQGYQRAGLYAWHAPLLDQLYA